jgi:hypothetical protein
MFNFLKQEPRPEIRLKVIDKDQEDIQAPEEAFAKTEEIKDVEIYKEKAEPELPENGGERGEMDMVGVEAKKELEILISRIESDISDNSKNVEYDEEKKSLKGKLVALCVATTIFMGAFAQNAEAGSYRSGISGDLERGAGRAVQDVFRGAGRGVSEGLDKGLEKTMLNAFGIETADQRRAREQYQRSVDQREREYLRNQQNQQRMMQSSFQKNQNKEDHIESEFRKELLKAGDELDAEKEKNTELYRLGKIDREKFDELMEIAKHNYKEEAERIKEVYSRETR